MDEIILKKPITPDFIKKVFDNSNILINREELEKIFTKISLDITDRHKKDNPIIVCLMKGGLFITSEISKRLHFPLQIDYVHASRYNNAYHGSDKINWIKEPHINPSDRTVILFDDILDQGLTLAAVKKYYETQNTKEILTAVMLDKKVERKNNGLLKADYTGVEVGNQFLFGFGLDYHGYLRNTPSIHAVPKKYLI